MNSQLQRMLQRAILAAIGIAFLLPVRGATAQDGYLCYQAKSTKVPAQAKFTGVEIDAKDQFQPGGRNYLAQKYVALCNPTDPATSGTVHHVELQVKDSKVHPNPSKFVKPATTYLLNDQFVTDLPVTIVKPKFVRIRAAKDDYGPITKCKVDEDCSDGDTCQSKLCLPPDTTPPAAPPAAPVDNFMCYQVKLGAKVSLPTNVSFTDQFGNHGNYDLKKVTKLCAPADEGGENPGAEGHAGHLTCYQAKPVKGSTKFLKREVATTTTSTGPQYLEVAKVTELCVPSTKTPEGGDTIPTTLTLTSDEPGGQCGTLTVSGTGEGVPLRRNPADASTDPNAVCTGAGAPKACCEGSGTGHCDERNSVVCGSLSFGGGGPSVGQPGGESVNAGGASTRYSLSCPSATGACTIGGNAGNLAGGVNCSTTGCGITTPIDETDPVKVCAVTRLASAASGSLDLATGEISLANDAQATVSILTNTSHADTACPRCRTSTDVNAAEVFSTGPTSPGIGVCDNDALNAGDTCYVFEPAGPTAGLSSSCVPDAGGSASIAINTTSTTAGDSVSDPAGHFCPGQGGNADCTADDVPQACCSGAGMGSCNNFNGCFGSGKYTDTPGLCTGISVTGSAAGALVVGAAPAPGSFGDVACIPAVNSGSPVLDGLVNNNAGLPGPVVTSTKVLFEVD